MASLEGYIPGEYLVSPEIYEGMVSKAMHNPKRPPLQFVVSQAAEEFHRRALLVEEQKHARACRELLPIFKDMRHRAETLLQEQQAEGKTKGSQEHTLHKEYNEVLEVFWRTEIPYMKERRALENIIEDKHLEEDVQSLHNEQQLSVLFISITCQNYIREIGILLTYL